MSFSPTTETTPVEPAEPDPFTSQPNPLTGRFPRTASQSFPGPLQLPAGSHLMAGSPLPQNINSPSTTFQPSHSSLPQQRHDSFSGARISVGHADERRAHGSFYAANDPYCNPVVQRHDSAAGINVEGRNHLHATGASDRYMLAEPTTAVLQYGQNRNERDSTSYASGSGSNNDIQGATIMGYGSGGLIYIRKRRGNLPKEATNFLKRWFDEHQHNPYPTEEDKQWMVRKTGLESNQISNWFINARRRRKHNRSPEQSYREQLSPSSEPPSPSASLGRDTPLDSPARPQTGFP